MSDGESGTAFSVKGVMENGFFSVGVGPCSIARFSLSPDGVSVFGAGGSVLKRIPFPEIEEIAQTSIAVRKRNTGTLAAAAGFLIGALLGVAGGHIVGALILCWAGAVFFRSESRHREPYVSHIEHLIMIRTREIPELSLRVRSRRSAEKFVAGAEQARRDHAAR